MQRDDGKQWSIGQLLFPLLVSLCILILRYRLKSSSMVGTADIKAVPEGVPSGDRGQREAGDGEDAIEREEQMKPDGGSDVAFSEEVDGDEGSAIAENGQEIENEEMSEDGEGGSEVEAYCVKCRQKRSMEDPREIETKNGRHALEGTCPVCGTHLFRFVAR